MQTTVHTSGPLRDATAIVTPPAGHNVAWLCVQRGALHIADERISDELVVFGESEDALAFTADEDSAFVLICDTEGLVLAGTLGGANGEGQRSQAACDLGVLANNLSRACAHLGLGAWESCLLESDHDAHAIALVGERVLVLSESAGEGAAGRLLARLPELSARAASHIGGAL